MKITAIISSIILLAGGAAAQKRDRSNDPDVKEMRDYKLSMDAIQRYMNAAAKVEADPAAKKCFDGNSPGNAATLDAGEKMLNSCPPAVADMKAAGIKPREFLVLTGALIGDMMAVGLKKNGTIKEYPATISPENAAFLEQNYDKVQKMLAPLNGGDK
jgi:hypothetical protein